MLAFFSRSDRHLGQAFRLDVPSDITPGPGGLLGLELEFSLRSQRGERVHFGSLIHRLALDGIALDPGDPNAYRCSWGGVITSDGAEAEIATPPVRARPGFTSLLRAWAQTGEAELRRAVPHGIELEGYSAHFSAAMPARLNDSVCLLYAQRFAPALMLLMDRADSPGLLIRPRPGRTELCGEFIEGEPLSAVAAFVAGTTRACAAAARRRSARALLPPSVDVRPARAVHRYGWYVDHEAFGTDLRTGWRHALLRRASGGTISAQSHLELAWAVAREALADDAAASDLQITDAMVAGSLPLPAEHDQSHGLAHGQRGGGYQSMVSGPMLPGAVPPRLCARARPGFTLRPITATWDFTVFEAGGWARTAYVCVPSNSLPGFIGRLEEGALDGALAGYMARPSRHRVLSARQQTRRLGLYDQMGAPTGLLAPERDPRTGRREPRQPGLKPTLARPGKRHRHQEPRQRTPPRFTRQMAIIAAVVAVVLAGAGAGVAAAISLGQGGPNGNPSAPLSFQPSAMSFPDIAVGSNATRSLTVTDSSGSSEAVTRTRIAGPGRNDFSVQGSPGRAHRSGLAIQQAALGPPPCLRHLPPSGTCKIAIEFDPLAPGKHVAYLALYLASSQRPRRITLTGIGTPSAALTLTPAALPAATTGTPYSQTISAVGGTGPYTYALSSGALPSGLSLDPQTGSLSGTPAKPGSYPFTVTATGPAPSTGTASQAYTLQVTLPTLTLTPAALPAATTGTPYSQTISAVGGTGPYTYALSSGALPSGLSLDPQTGSLSGTPAKPGSYPFTVTATGPAPSTGTASQAYTLQVTLPTLTLTPAALPAATTGISGTCPAVFYDQTITAVGGTPPYTYQITSRPPPKMGLSSSTGVVVLSGTPTTPGSYTFTVTATDSSSPTPQNVSQTYTVVENPC